jgi:hypothetical protein
LTWETLGSRMVNESKLVAQSALLVKEDQDQTFTDWALSDERQSLVLERYFSRSAHASGTPRPLQITETRSFAKLAQAALMMACALFRQKRQFDLTESPVAC